MISSKKVVAEPTAGVNESKVYPKLPKIASLPIYSVIVQILFSISTYFCVSQRKISLNLLVIKLMARIRETKICPKSAENFKYSYLQCNYSNIK